MPGRMRFKAAQQIRVVAERQVRVQAVDDVDFGERLVAALPELVEHLLHRHGVRAGHRGRSRANEQNRQDASQTLVASRRRL